jgi:hypothetical protein
LTSSQVEAGFHAALLAKVGKSSTFTITVKV